ncbi:MAG TPA: TIGR03016 family PEP-CTERM system-associated outer membrane protein [Alphaproteobacteria bacterium]|jgi:uncharacterized protein (PEP-CTERM system associated)|nr:TIGR03016 family PEP-CTERM system-associated outer membrane protein [Alphaproteobacteria bacterium]
MDAVASLNNVRQAWRDAGRPFAFGIAASLLAGSALAEPGLQLTPSIGFQETITDNSAGGGASKFETVSQISPGIAVHGETPYLTVDGDYTPTYNKFNTHSSPDRLDQQLNVNGTFKPIENVLTMDFQAFAQQAAGTGNFTNVAGALVPSVDRFLYYTAVASPHYSTHFGSVATFDAYYRLTSTNSSDEGIHPDNRPSASTNSLGQNAEIAIASTDSLGRLGVRLDLNYGSTSGSGQNTASTNSAYVIGTSFHLDRTYQLTSSIGYETIDYPSEGTTKGYRSQGTTWSIGATITPNSLSSISVGYGLSQGSYNPSLQVGYALGPRTNLVMSYVVSVQNQLTSTVQNLRFLTYDQFGNAIDSRTGLPFSGVNQTFGSQNVLFRDKPALITLSHQLFRSGITLTANYETRESLSEPKQSDRAWGLSVNYNRDFTPLIQGSIGVGFTSHVSSVLGVTEHVKNYSATASLFYKLSDTATATLTETYYGLASDVPVDTYSNEQLTIGIRKSF